MSPKQVQTLKRLVAEAFGPEARLRVFGSRVDDRARGGDVDLLVEVDAPVERPSLRSARLAARAQRALDGRRVDVLLAAPNLAEYPIHEIARREGVLV